MINLDKNSKNNCILLPPCVLFLGIDSISFCVFRSLSKRCDNSSLDFEYNFKIAESKLIFNFPFLSGLNSLIIS